MTQETGRRQPEILKRRPDPEKRSVKQLGGRIAGKLPNVLKGKKP